MLPTLPQACCKQRFGSLVINFAAYEVLLKDNIVPLTRSEFSLLATLAQRPRQVIRSRDLLQAMWDQDWESDTTLLQTHVSRLRRKLGESGTRHHFIKTVRGVGYRFEPEAESVSRSVELLFDDSLILRKVTPHEPFLGYDPDTIIGTMFAPSGINPGRRKTALAKLLAKGQMTLDIVVLMEHADGDQTFVQVVTDIMIDLQGHFTGLSSTIHLPD